MNCINMKRTIAISFIVVAAVVAVSEATKQERKESATSSEEDVYLSMVILTNIQLLNTNDLVYFNFR